MPIYEFECRSCRAATVRHQSSYEIRPQTCERCGTMMELVIPRPSVVYRGEGWAKKDRQKEAR